MHSSFNEVLYEKIGLQLENQLGSLKMKILIDLNLIEFEMRSKGLKSGLISLFQSEVVSNMAKYSIWPNTKYQ